VSRLSSIWPVVIVSALGILILCGLGGWQLQRLAQKQTLLAEMDRRSMAKPIDLTEAIGLHNSGENVEYLKISAKGRYLHDDEKHLIGVLDGNPAWEVVTPMLTADNTLVLVDRGLVPDGMRDPATRAENNPAADVEVAGVLRGHREQRGPFIPDNDIKANMWFWWDVPGMLESTAMPLGAKPVPFVLHVLPAEGGNGFPRPVTLQAALRNNHLQYAITWFGLALALAVIAGLFVSGQMKNSGA